MLNAWITQELFKGKLRKYLFLNLRALFMRWAKVVEIIEEIKKQIFYFR